MSSAAVQQQTAPVQQAAYQQTQASSPATARRSRQGHDIYDLAQNTPSSSSTVKQSSMSSAPVVENSAQQYDQHYSDSQRQINLPVRSAQAANTPSSPSAAYESRHSTSGARPQQFDVSGNENDRRQRTPRSSHDSPAQPSSGRSQRARQGPAQSRSQNAVGQPPIGTDLPRENSAIINHIVIDDPQTDVARERARAEARPIVPGQDTPINAITLDQAAVQQQSSSQPRSRQEHLRNASTQNRKEVKFGEYILGQTLGEGEFGKVKMGWKKEGGVQVAIKLIRKESLAGNTTRLPKIYREISILKEVEHPNIVRLHEFVETERHMGIILEYASGGELFDYILNHRYLKDPAAKRLFAQLVSGVGYLHRKGIVHRDLKLENLLLDRYKNIIITDFGFANTFDPNDELGEDVEHKINDKDFIRREGLEAIGKNGLRRGDLMMTSCGSPCYAAPELVVSDGLYTGRKVDVWSCGVILYAMLAGYLPFDDDPANPDGDNINLLYKYIVTTPLTFPEYVTPHARDLLRRILVADPRKRADLFEVARHSWLSDYSHLVGFIGSSTKSDRDIAKSAMRQGDEPGVLGRSASVREPSTRSPNVSTIPPKTASAVADDTRSRTSDTKRRTVQVEYVAPNGQQSPALVSPVSATGRTRARADSQGPIEVSPINARPQQQIPRKEIASQSMAPPIKSREGQQPRSPQEGGFVLPAAASSSRPNTRGNLPSRGNSYSQPAIATPTTENAQGRFAQPKTNPSYAMSGSISPPSSQTPPIENRPGSHQAFNQFQHTSQQMPTSSGHKRSSTLGSITDRVLGRSNSRRKAQQQQDGVQNEKRDRRFPPVSMNNNVMGNAQPQPSEEGAPRRSTDSRRSSFQFLRKNSEQQYDAQGQPKRASRRLSNFLPGNFSFSKNNQQYDPDQPNKRTSMQQSRGGRPASKGMGFGRGTSPSPSMSTTNSGMPGQYSDERNNQRRVTPDQQAMPAPVQRKQFRDDGYGGNLLDQQSQHAEQSSQQLQDQNQRYYAPAQDFNQQRMANGQDYQSQSQPQLQQYRADGYSNQNMGEQPLEQTTSNVQSIRPQQRRFGDAYDRGHEGSSSGARRVMDFFRRRGKDRTSKE